MHTRILIGVSVVVVGLGMYFIAKDWEPKFKKIVIFGDSLSDVGNTYAFTGNENPKEPYYEGRFSNGPLWIEVFAQGMGMEVPQPSLKGGTNCAFGGARTGYGNRDGKPDIGLQIDGYLKKTGGKVNKRDLIVLSGGSNDFIRGNPIRTIPNIVEHITKLVNAGGRTFLVTNFPPLGCLPVFTHELPIMVEASMMECLESSVDPEIHRYLETKVGPKVAGYLKKWIPSVKEYLPSLKNYLPILAEEFMKRLGGHAGEKLTFKNSGDAVLNGATAISEMYNNYLELALNDLERKLKIKIYRLDVSGIFLELVGNPEKYGFKYIDVPALDAQSHALMDGVNPEDYVFFDGIHPVSKTHRYVGNAAVGLFRKRK